MEPAAFSSKRTPAGHASRLPARRRVSRLLPAFASIAIIAIAAYVLWRRLADVDPGAVSAGFAAISGSTLLRAGLFTAGALLAMAICEVWMLRYLRPQAGWRRPFVTALIAYPIGHAVGFGAFSGGAIRYRIYSAAGFDAADVGKLVVLSVMPYALGLGLLAATSMLFHSLDAALALHLEPTLVALLGAGLLAAHVGYVGLVLGRVRLFGGWWPAFELPSPALTAVQYALGVVEVLCAVTVLYVLLPPAAHVGFVAFLAVYVTAVAAGALSGVPAGLGVFESILLLTLSDVPAEALLGAVLAYRLVYELLPFVIGLLLLIAYEASAPRRAE